MKKSIKIIVSLLLILSFVLLTGCNKVDSITINESIKYISDKGYEYQYYKDYERDHFKIDEAILCKIDDNTVLEFYSFEDARKAQSFFDTIKYNLNEYSKLVPESDFTVKQEANNKSLILDVDIKDELKYFRVSLKNNTIMYGFTNSNNKEPIDKIFAMANY